MKRSHHALDFIKGHYDCGACRASVRSQDLGELSVSRYSAAVYVSLTAL
jgi:carbonic anhydrase